MKEASIAPRTKTTRFKQTEVGLIPEDWVVISLGEIFEFKNGLNKEKHYFGKGTPIVNYMDVFKNNGIKANDLFGRVTLTQQEIKNFEVKKGDVFFTRTSETVQEIGVSSVLLDDVKNTVFSGFILRARSINDKIDLDFKKYCFATKEVRKEIISKSSYTTRALTNGRLLSSVKMAIPPSLPEQTAIAQALSDADALIAGLEKLIEKKKKIKQGAMQELLRPKEGWVKKKLGDLAEIVMGQSPLSKYYNSKAIGLPLIQGNADILNRKTIIRNYTAVITKKGRSGDIIMSVRAPVGEVSRATFDCCLGRGVCAIRFPNDYLYHYLVFFENNWSKVSTGSTFESVNAAQVQDVYIDLPKFESIQIEIASTLSDMDNEISTLNGKLSKAVLTKQGMMQNLLTGKIRLV